ncbi:MAG: hypothetical protein ACRD3I_05675, partial [Terriglobales bacterium]
VFTAVAEVVSITPPGATVDIIDVTHLESPNRFREKVASIKDSTDISMTCNATEANLPILYAALGLEKNFKVTSNTELNLQWIIRGFIKEVTPGELSNDGALTCELVVTVKGSSVPTLLV